MEKMDFESFKSWAAKGVAGRLPESYAGVEPMFHTVEKLGSSYTGLTFLPEGHSAAATINLEEMYGIYCGGASEEDIIKDMAAIAVMKPPLAEGGQIGDYDAVKKRLFVRLSNLSENRSLLEQMPHRTIDDMALTYHILSGLGPHDMWCAAVSNDLLESFGISEDRLYEDAMENSPVILPARMEEIGNSFNYILTNFIRINGASVILYPGVLAEAAEELGDDIIIIPTSVNEVFLLPQHSVPDIRKLEQTHRLVNLTQNPPGESLSDHIYRYDAKKCLFERATAAQ